MRGVGGRHLAPADGRALGMFTTKRTHVLAREAFDWKRSIPLGLPRQASYAHTRTLTGTFLIRIDC